MRKNDSVLQSSRWFRFAVPGELFGEFERACRGALDGADSYQDVLRRYVLEFIRGDHRSLPVFSHDGRHLAEGRLALNRRTAGKFVACCRFESQHCDEMISAFMVAHLATRKR